ncbi:MAG: carbohydrate ABC transporter permease [Chloroflexi bacterium]|nr:carbohydrate ABC transporter permease [Chloroflexota bacterium]MCY3583666.1 carbohydrate ABC transporter permease [Chloroflexota bacterium]MCY3716946.1 carbohydrate ABC transporter permease [Chloroflexota bacterium]MDE2650130.1 carbohydrate ABC transporter permease [Chloroflexota bacterium]MXX49582.1 carbohydrate ABC transporter permease [Chloroflexota bacterium]
MTKSLTAGKLLETAALLLIIFFIMLPILWLALTSIKPQEKAYTTDILFTPTLDNFRIIFSDTSVLINAGTDRERGEVGRNMLPSVVNSVVVSGATILIAIPLATIAAYAFSRYLFLGNRALLIWILTTQFIPAIVVAIPFFTLFRSIEVFNRPLLGTQLGLIIVNMSIVLPYAIWMIKGFVDALPGEIEEAAYVDGCNDFQVLFYISLPLIRPGILVASVFAFIMSWNEFLFALIIGREMRTMQVALMTTSGARGIMWEQMAAAGLVVMLPIFVLAMFIRKNVVYGLTMGAVK